MHEPVLVKTDRPYAAAAATWLRSVGSGLGFDRELIELKGIFKKNEALKRGSVDAVGNADTVGGEPVVVVTVPSAAPPN
jgi:hypothetical protein